MTEQELKDIATLVIYNYYGGFYTKEYIEANFNLAINLMVENSRIRISGASMVSENGTSITFSDALGRFNLNSDILALLPKKKNFKAW